MQFGKGKHKALQLVQTRYLHKYRMRKYPLKQFSKNKEVVMGVIRDHKFNKCQTGRGGTGTEKEKDRILIEFCSPLKSRIIHTGKHKLECDEMRSFHLDCCLFPGFALGLVHMATKGPCR